MTTLGLLKVPNRRPGPLWERGALWVNEHEEGGDSGQV